MRRRRFLGLAAAGMLAAACPAVAADAAPEQIMRHPRPGEADWPGAGDWAGLRSQLGPRCIMPVPPFEQSTPNPFERETAPGATQSAGWAGAWSSAPSACAVAAESAQDVATAINFAVRHRLRLVIKGTGHDYLGRSTSPDALLIWTHRMRQITWHDNFVPRDAPPGTVPVQALSVQAGTRWLEAYQEATTRHGRYVQGGGCSSVGVAGGFIQGGGFGSFSKRYGTGAASVLEYEVVTADGHIRVVNDYREPDLFWALRGGGGSTFGVVTRVTLLTHALPSNFGGFNGTIRAVSDEAYRDLIERFCEFYCSALNNPHWGEQFSFRGDNSMGLSLVFSGLSEAEVAQTWAPLLEWLRRVPDRYQVDTRVGVVPARDMWNVDWWRQKHPNSVHPDPTNPAGFWWAGNTGEVGAYWYAYMSRWIPLNSFQDAAMLARAVFDASRHWHVSMHINKGLAGATDEVLARCRQTSMNPQLYEAAALAILGAAAPGAPDAGAARDQADRVRQAMSLLRSATPDSGSYVNETDYFEANWQHAFWGSHYARLLDIKRRYDPLGLFHCHHSVGSEGWSPDGMTRTLN